MHICNPSSQEAEAGRLTVSSRSAWATQQDLVSKQNKTTKALALCQRCLPSFLGLFTKIRKTGEKVGFALGWIGRNNMSLEHFVI
jgi:hypothetical protein